MGYLKSTLFSGKSQIYDDFRPEYPKDIVERIESKFNLKIDGRVAEFGSGTGKFTKLLKEKVSHLSAIDPDKEMLNHLVSKFDNVEHVFPILGTAEDSTILSHSLDFIFSSQAFHHFNPKRSISEFERILKRSGKIVLVWHFFNMEVPISGEIRKCFYRYGDLQSQKKRLKITDQSINLLFSNSYVESSNLGIINQELNIKSFLGSMCSSSYAPHEKSTLYQTYLSEFKNIFNNHHMKGKVVCSFYIIGYCIHLGLKK